MARIDLGHVLGTEPHPPAVYFIRLGGMVKIGTTTAIRRRLYSMYLGIEDLLWIEPGGEPAEREYHRRFHEHHVRIDARRELFRLEGTLQEFLGSKPAFTIEPAPDVGPMTPETIEHMAAVARGEHSPQRAGRQVPETPGIIRRNGMRLADLNLITEARQRSASGLARSLRERARMSQDDAAGDLSRRLAAGRRHERVSRASVAAWETGRRLPRGPRAVAYGRFLRDLANRQA